MLAFIHLIAAGEALMLCAKAGVDLRAAFEAIAASSGNSFVHETESQVILNGSYDIGFTMDLACKDAGFALEFGRRFGVPLRLAGVMEQTFIEGRAQVWRRGLVVDDRQAPGGRRRARRCAPRASRPVSVPSTAEAHREAANRIFAWPNRNSACADAWLQQNSGFRWSRRCYSL